MVIYTVTPDKGSDLYNFMPNATRSRGRITVQGAKLLKVGRNGLSNEEERHKRWGEWGVQNPKTLDDGH